MTHYSSYLSFIPYLAILALVVVAAYLKVLPLEFVAPIFTGVIGVAIPSPLTSPSPPPPTPTKGV